MDINKVVFVNINEKDGLEKIIENRSTYKNLNSILLSSKDCLISVERTGIPSIIYNNQRLNTDDTFFIFKSYKGDVYFTYLLGLICEKQNRLYSDEANLQSSNSADKMTMTTVLPMYGLKTPSSIICTPHAYKINCEYTKEKVKYPCVVKKTGSKGKRVWLVKNQTELEEKINLDEELTIIQEYIPNDHDFRVFVFDEKVIGSIKRSSTDGFYNNVSQGGKAESVVISEEEAKDCVEATKLAKLRLSGVDMVRHEGEHFFFEVNKNPQLGIFSESLGLDLEQKIIDLMLSNVKTKG